MAKIAEVQEVAVSSLKPYERNAKIHGKEQIEKLKASILEFGFLTPCLIDRDNNIIAGHGRVMAASELGMQTVPCVYIEGLTEAQRRAYILADNRLGELGEWNMDIVDLELTELDDMNFDVSVTGFELPSEDDDVEITEDEVPEPPEEPKTKLGDIWQLGDHRLICGDSTDVDVIDRLMDGVKADMVFTDPPYGYEYQSNFRTKTEKFDVLENDDKILDFFPNLVGRVNGFVMICTSWKVLDKWIPLFNKYFDLTNMIIWEKGGGSMGDLKHTFGTDYEVILTSNNGAEITGKRLMSVWKVARDDVNSYQHPTQKPVGISAMGIENTTKPNNRVLDLFCGSGSTLIACEQLNRKCFMCELDPHYCDVIINRWETFTGREAVLING